MKKTKKMTLQNFAFWLEETCNAQWRLYDGTLYAVISINHIEPGLYAALYAEDEDGEIMVTELTDYFLTPWEAKIALGIKETQDDQGALPLSEWLNTQYLTDHDAKIRQICL